jgi:hypothetical protein
MAVAPIEVTGEPLEIQPICLITVDSIHTVNVVVWEKPVSTAIDYYNIYKESTVADVYFLAGSVDYDSLSIFTDPNSNPKQRSWRYKMTAVDLCGNESDFSDVHKTMHVAISHGLGTDYNLSWNDYDGYSYGSYYLYRYRPSTGWVSMDTLPSSNSSYTDFSVPQGEVNYVVETKHPNGCLATKTKNFNSSKSNTSFAIASGPLSVTISATDASLGNCDGTATVLPAGGSPPYTYLWDDSLAQSNATAAGLCPGTYSVMVVDADGNTIIETITVGEDAIGFPEHIGKRNVKVTPNPFTESTVLEFDNKNNEALILLLYDITGKVVREYKEIRGNKVIIRRKNLIAGTYYYQLKGEQGSNAGQFMVE